MNTMPVAFHLTPDFKVVMNKDLLDSAEQTSEDPQTIVYKIKQNAAWSDGTPISADDFIYLWKNLNGTIKDNDVSGTTGYDQIKSVEGSDNGKTVTVVFKTPFSDWKALFASGNSSCPPTTWRSSRAAGTTAWTRTPRRSPPAARSSSTTTARAEPDDGPQREVLRGRSPTSTRSWSGSCPSRPPSPRRSRTMRSTSPTRSPRSTWCSGSRRFPDVNSQINFGPVVRALRLQLPERAARRPQGRGRRSPPASNVEELVDRTVKQFSDRAEALDNRIWLNNQPEYQDNSGKYGKGDMAEATKLLEEAGYTKGTDGIYAKGGKKL